MTVQPIAADTPMGANVVPGGTTFRVWAPTADAVHVALHGPGHPDPAHWRPEEGNKLIRDQNGYWGGFVSGVGEGALYRFWTVGPAGCGLQARPSGARARAARLPGLRRRRPRADRLSLARCRFPAAAVPRADRLSAAHRRLLRLGWAQRHSSQPRLEISRCARPPRVPGRPRRQRHSAATGGRMAGHQQPRLQQYGLLLAGDGPRSRARRPRAVPRAGQSAAAQEGPIGARRRGPAQPGEPAQGDDRPVPRLRFGRDPRCGLQPRRRPLRRPEHAVLRPAAEPRVVGSGLVLHRGRGLGRWPDLRLRQRRGAQLPDPQCDDAPRGIPRRRVPLRRGQCHPRQRWQPVLPRPDQQPRLRQARRHPDRGVLELGPRQGGRAGTRWPRVRRRLARRPARRDSRRDRRGRRGRSAYVDLDAVRDALRRPQGFRPPGRRSTTSRTTIWSTATARTRARPSRAYRPWRTGRTAATGSRAAVRASRPACS